MHDNIPNYSLITRQPNHSFKTRVDVAGTFNTFAIEEDKLQVVRRNLSVFSDDTPSVGCCVSGELDLEFYSNFVGSSAQEAFRGTSIIWNQLWNRKGWKHVSGTYTPYGTGWFKDADTNYSIANPVVGHKYYAKLSVKDSVNYNYSEIYFGSGSYKCRVNGNGTASAIFTAASSSTILYTVRDYESSQSARNFSGDYKLVLIDLTRMFGSGHEPTTADTFEALFNSDFYPANAGSQMVYDPFAIPKMGKLSVFVNAEAVINNQLVQSGDIPKGQFYIDTRELAHTMNGDDTVIIHAYDAMLQMEQPCYTEMPIVWNNVTMQQVLNHISDVTGVEIDSRTVINPNYIAEFPGVGEGAYTMREVLGIIGAAHCGNWIINDLGKLQLIPLRFASAETDYLLDTSRVPLTFGGTRILLGS